MSRKTRRRLIQIGVVLIVVLAILIAVFVFRVHKISVSGNTNQSSEQIAGDLMTDFLSENTLYLLWTLREGEPPERMPYLESIHVTMKSPISINVAVVEKPLVGYLEDGDYIYFDAEGIVENISGDQIEGLPIITGVNLGEVTLYQKVPTESGSQLRTVLNLLDLLDYYGLEAEEISFSEDLEITVYMRHIEVDLGQDEYLEEKIANLNAVLKNISETTGGILHLENVTGKYEDIIFTPTGEVTDETDGEEDEENGSIAAADGTTLVGTSTDGSTAAENNSADEKENNEGEDEEEEEEDSSAGVALMVFNSYGSLVYNVSVKDGVVVDGYGNEVPGCSIDEDGNIVDAYMNVIDPATGDLLN